MFDLMTDLISIPINSLSKNKKLPKPQTIENVIVPLICKVRKL
jgi:hypothetical protein